MMQADEVITYIVTWLTDYASKAKSKGFVVGVSGGIDSAVTSTLCAKTGLPTLCIEMPIHQAESHVSRAREHISFLKENFSNVTDTKVDLTPTFEQFKTEVSLEGEKPVVDMALANTRSRLRMTSLYYYAGLLGRLVAGTGNKVEDFGVGFYTKYGDGGVDVSPIADLMKSEVYKIGQALNIVSSIMVAKPSDGLFGDDISDEDQIGANYDELEWAMQMQEQGKVNEDFDGRQLEVFKIYCSFNRRNQHKMTPIPVCEIPLDIKKS